MRNALPFDLDAMREHADEAADLLKAMANAQRLRILCLLAGGEHSVGDLNAKIDLRQSALSQHLSVLRLSRLVVTRREAQTVYYRLADGPAELVMETLHGIYCVAPTRGANRSGRSSPSH